MTSAITKNDSNPIRIVKNHIAGPLGVTNTIHKDANRWRQQHNIDGGTNATINMKRAQKTHVPLAVRTVATSVQGGVIHPSEAVDSVGGVVDMVGVEVDGFRA